MLLALLNPTHFVSSSGYLAVFLLSVLQSCCVPTSSELTLGFAGVLAAEGKMSLAGAIGAGAGGELVGAYIAWIIGRTGGRAFVDRYGKYILLSHRDLDRAEAWYDRHDRWGVFGSRLLPVIRNFVALPAGVAEVPIVRFGILTALGSLIWDAAMAIIGYEVGGKWKSVMHGVSYAGYLLGALVVVALAFLIYHRYRSYKAATAPGAAPGGQWSPGPSTARAPGGGTTGRRRGQHFASGGGARQPEATQARPSTNPGGNAPASTGVPGGELAADTPGEISPRQQP